MLAVALLMGATAAEAKTTKKKGKARTSQSSKKSSTPSGTVATINLGGGHNLYLTANGIVKGNPSYDEDGKYIKDGNAYLLVWGPGTYGGNYFGVVKGNTYYQIINSWYDDEEFWGYLDDNNWDLNDAVSFDPSSETVIYKTTAGTKRQSLSDVPSSNRHPVTR